MTQNNKTPKKNTKTNQNSIADRLNKLGNLGKKNR